MGVRYFLRVSACNSVGCGQPQQSTPTREHPRQLPKSPTVVRLEPTSPSLVTVSFSPPTSNGGDTVTSYRVEWDIDPEFESSATAVERIRSGSCSLAWLERLKFNTRHICNRRCVLRSNWLLYSFAAKCRYHDLRPSERV